MFDIFKKKYSLVGCGALNGFVDRHCHLLPGVDDGVETMDETLAILKDYEQWGFRQVWFTPHIMEDMPNTPVRLKERFEEVKQAYNGPLNLQLSAENMLDNLFLERLAAGELMKYGDEGNELLVETSYAQAPIGFYDILDSIMRTGLRPVLAHPERYIYMGDPDYDRLKAMGIKFQMNITSYIGRYGSIAKMKAENLYKKGYYSYFGTDCHSIDSIEHAVTQKVLKEKEFMF